jgi:hypothetical protein
MCGTGQTKSQYSQYVISSPLRSRQHSVTVSIEDSRLIQRERHAQEHPASYLPEVPQADALYDCQNGWPKIPLH